MPSLNYLLQLPFSARQKRLANDRPPITLNEFTEAISTSELGRDAARLLWEELNAVKVVSEFSPYPDDNILTIYGLAEEDLDEDTILRIAEKLGIDITSYNQENLPTVKTPRDIISLIVALANSAPKH
jgi:hypothetical protein